MKKLKPSTQYKKDVKRILNNPRKLKALQEIVDKLKNEIPIPAKNKPHMLTGNYSGYMECHIEGDFNMIFCLLYLCGRRKIANFGLSNIMHLILS